MAELDRPYGTRLEFLETTEETKKIDAACGKLFKSVGTEMAAISCDCSSQLVKLLKEIFEITKW